jgi:hypothetical protein
MIIDDEAREELVAAATWYDEQRAGLATNSSKPSRRYSSGSHTPHSPIRATGSTSELDGHSWPASRSRSCSSSTTTTFE